MNPELKKYHSEVVTYPFIHLPQNPRKLLETNQSNYSNLDIINSIICVSFFFKPFKILALFFVLSLDSLLLYFSLVFYFGLIYFIVFSPVVYGFLTCFYPNKFHQSINHQSINQSINQLIILTF